MTWELRHHPFRDEWVLFTAHRGARPWVGETVADEEPEVPSDNALAIWDRLWQAGQAFGVTAVVQSNVKGAERLRDGRQQSEQGQAGGDSSWES